MIELKQVSFSYNQAVQLSEIDLKIEKGQCVLVTGPSGCGKTTLTRVINGLIPHYYEGELQGSVTLAGQAVESLPSWTFGQLVGSVFQDPRSQFFTATVADELAFAAENYGCDPEAIKTGTERILKQHHIQHLAQGDLLNLSSGEKQKVAMGAVEVLAPEIFLLDEPSANLDQQSTRQLTEILQSLKQQGKTILVADHRIHYLMDVADRIVYMEAGKIKGDWSVAEFQGFGRQQLAQMKLRSHCDSELTATYQSNQNDSYLSVAGLAVAASQQQKNLLTDLNFSLGKGEVLLLTGRNGLGKTTLAKTLCGLQKARRGEIRVQGQRLTAKQRQQKFWFVLQDADYQLFADSVLNELLLGFKQTEALIRQAEELLAALALADFKDQHPQTLSGGQKQRLVFAAGLMREPEIMILDEPTSGLDAGSMRQIQALIRTYQKKGVTFLVITHDAEFAREFDRNLLELTPAPLLEKAAFA